MPRASSSSSSLSSHHGKGFAGAGGVGGAAAPPPAFAFQPPTTTKTTKTKTTFGETSSFSSFSAVGGGGVPHAVVVRESSGAGGALVAVRGGGSGGGNSKIRRSMAARKPLGSPEDDAKAYSDMVSADVDVREGYVRDGRLTATRSVRDIDTNARRTYSYNIPLSRGSTGGGGPLYLEPPTELSSKIKFRCPSPSGSKVAILLEEDDNDSGGGTKKKKQTVEVWTEFGHRLARRIVVSNSHGPITNDSWFGTMSWNADETALVYGAEPHPPKTQSFFARSKGTSKGRRRRGEGDGDVAIGSQYELGYGLTEHWGEKYADAASATHDLFCLHVQTGKIGKIINVPGGGKGGGNAGNGSSSSTEGGYHLGQPIFSPCGTSVVYVAWDAGGGGEMPKRLGIVHCQHRPSKIYSSPVSGLLRRLASTEQEDDADGVEEEEERAVLVDHGDEHFTCLTPHDRLARSPRFSDTTADGMAQLVYLGHPDGFDTHSGCMALNVVNWNVTMQAPRLDTWRCLVKPIRVPGEREGDDAKVAGIPFPGLFTVQLPSQKCFTPDGRYVVLTTQWGPVTKVVRVSTRDGSVIPLNFDLLGRIDDDDDDSINQHLNNNASQTLLCMDDRGGLIVTQSEPHHPTVLGHVDADSLLLSSGGTAAVVVDSRLLAKLPPISASSFSSVSADATSFVPGKGFAYHVLNMSAKQSSSGVAEVKGPVRGILLLPDNPDQEKLPLLVVPHGGPHTATSTQYVPSYTYLCQHGRYAVLFVNYRGSAGFGQSALESLAGTAGSLDVHDVVAATRTVMESGIVDPDRVGICGGSHGGYLAAHCIGQHPGIYKAAAMRNPVTNIATMVTATDIPDWCYVETFGTDYYDWKSFRGPTKDELAQMLAASPIVHVDTVEAPTLVALGMADKRVPPSQGLEYYHALRSKGVKTKLLMYEKDDHAIDRVASEADHWVNIKRWFDEHL